MNILVKLTKLIFLFDELRLLDNNNNKNWINILILLPVFNFNYDYIIK